MSIRELLNKISVYVLLKTGAQSWAQPSLKLAFIISERILDLGWLENIILYHLVLDVYSEGSGKVCQRRGFYCPLNIKYDLGGSLSLQKSALLQMEYILLGKFLQHLQADVFEMSGVAQYFC